MKGALALALGGLVLVAAVLWFVLTATEPDERVRELQADSARKHAELVVLRDSVRIYKQWVQEANERFAETCRMLPFRDADECRYTVQVRLERRRR